jgi:tryptophan-rich sensory protein
MSNDPVSKRGLSRIVWLLIAFAAAAAGGVASVNSPEFYRQLDRPAWAPPGSVFGPVWAVLYTMQGIAAWLVWRRRDTRGARVALVVFLLQLALNGLWTWIFFSWRQGGLAFAEILVLLALIIATIGLFWRIRPLAAALLLPYAGWVAFASALTFAIWRRNPSLLT